MLHLGRLHGLIDICVACFFMPGSIPDVICIVLPGRLSILSRRSKCCSVAGLTFALTSNFRSDGSANVTNLGCGVIWGLVW